MRGEVEATSKPDLCNILYTVIMEMVQYLTVYNMYHGFQHKIFGPNTVPPSRFSSPFSTAERLEFYCRVSAFASRVMQNKTSKHPEIVLTHTHFLMFLSGMA